MLSLTSVDKIVLLLPSIILSVSTKSASILFLVIEAQIQTQHTLLWMGTDVAHGSQAPALASWGQLLGSQGIKNHPQGMVSWRSYVPCARSCKVGGYPLLLPALKDSVFHGVSSAGSRDGEGTPQGKDTLNFLKKLLALQNASMWPGCYYSFSHFPIWVAEKNWWGFWVKRILFLVFHYENGESKPENTLVKWYLGEESLAPRPGYKPLAGVWGHLIVPLGS